jgi:hypothetical protein
MPIDQKVVEAARSDYDQIVIGLGGMDVVPEASDRARRVLNAQAECISDGAVRAALKAAPPCVALHDWRMASAIGGP